jgi:hypothetical protein
MISKRKKVYSDDLLNITGTFLKRLQKIDEKLGDDLVINQGLFLMTTAHFEEAIRELIRTVLVAFPEKLTKDSCTISREKICEIADKGHGVIIDNELYSLFRDGVRNQLEKLFKILFNKERKKEKKPSNKNEISDEETTLIVKIEEISLYRNALIHDGGKVNIEINEKVKFLKPNSEQDLRFDSELTRLFMNVYKEFFQKLNNEIQKTFSSYNELSMIEKIKNVWKECFSSPILQFEDYWEIDYDQDLITGIKYPEVEDIISSSEKVKLSIWRHQYDDSIKTEEFLLCSVDHHKIYQLYEGLDNLKFYYMRQKAGRR